MKNDISTNVAVARSTRRRRRSKDDYGQFVSQEEYLQFLCFWSKVILSENHPMRSLVKLLIEDNEKIHICTAVMLFRLNSDNNEM